MTQPNDDASVLARIQRLVNEEHRLFERGELGADPSQAHARDADVVKNYVG